MRIDTWHGCYDAGWRGLITPESYSHPAKMSRALVVRIFDRLFDTGTLKAGDLCVDPFNGIGSTGIEAASRGVRYVGCELEPTFVDITRANFEMHRRDWETMGRPLPGVVQGDSRRLREVLRLAGVDVCVSSPPYAESGQDYKRGWSSIDKSKGVHNHYSRQEEASYGTTSGQLGAMPSGSVAAVVRSPPFTQGYAGGGGINVDGYVGDKRKPGWSGTKEGPDPVGSRTYQGTGAVREAGNMETMPFGDVAAVASPAGQLGQEAGETFWSAARDIIAESYSILKPGGTAVWVVKSFVRNKQIVDFPGDWRALCESLGFVTTLEVHASLVSETTHGDLFDGTTTKRTERKSFFRRLAEKKGSPRIDFETVWFMVRPR